MGFPWKKVLSIGGAVGNLVLPIAAKATGIGILAQIPAVIAGVEDALGPGTGETKKRAALEIIMNSICIAEGIAKQDLVDNEAAMDAIDGMIEHIVAFEKAINWNKPKIA
jgi:hypothetical protein